MNADIEARQKYLQDVTSFIKSHETNISEILAKVGWTEEKLLEDNGSQEKNEEPEIFDGTSVAGPSKEQPIKSTEVVYDEIMGSIPQKSTESKEKTWLELLAAERDLKRRRLSYKGKIHTKNKSHTEVMKEVIKQQMDALQGLEEEEPDEPKPITMEEENLPDLVEVRLPRTCNPHTAWKSVHKYITDNSEDESKRSNKDGYKDRMKDTSKDLEHFNENSSVHKYRRLDYGKISRSSKQYENPRNKESDIRNDKRERYKTLEDVKRPDIKRRPEGREYRDVNRYDRPDKEWHERRREKDYRRYDPKFQEHKRSYASLDNKSISQWDNSGVPQHKSNSERPDSFEHRNKLPHKTESPTTRERYQDFKDKGTKSPHTMLKKSKRKHNDSETSVYSDEKSSSHKRRKKRKKSKKSKKHKRKSSPESDSSSE